MCILEAITKVNYTIGEDFMLGVDVASTEMFDEAKKLGNRGVIISGKQTNFSLEKKW